VQHPSAQASSAIQATLLLLAITFLLAALVLLLSVHLPGILPEETVPAIFVISDIRHTNKYGQMVEEGRVALTNIGPADYQNWNLYAITYVNGKRLPADIPSLNAYEIAQIPNHHGIQNLEGLGSSGTKDNHNAFWVSGASLAINYNNHSIRPGDVVTIEIYDTASHTIISRDTYPHKEESKQEMMMREYLSRLCT
jgi:hypothetical protein